MPGWRGLTTLFGGALPGWAADAKPLDNCKNTRNPHPIRGSEPHTLKLSPQEQEALALGLVNLKPPPIILSEKSSTVPLR